MSDEKELHVVTNADELYDLILKEYMRDSVELSINYFDGILVKMPKKDILLTYKHLQEEINGDYVCRIEWDNQRGRQEYDEDEDFIPAGEYEDIYEGNCIDFLNTFTDKRLRRFNDDDEGKGYDFID